MSCAIHIRHNSLCDIVLQIEASEALQRLKFRQFCLDSMAAQLQPIDHADKAPVDHCLRRRGGPAEMLGLPIQEDGPLALLQGRDDVLRVARLQDALLLEQPSDLWHSFRMRYVLAKFA